jgi:nucleoside-diphosphate-sugar epimerase
MHSNDVSLTYEEFDQGLLYKETGFKPQISFEAGIKETARWIEQNG